MVRGPGLGQAMKTCMHGRTDRRFTSSSVTAPICLYPDDRPAFPHALQVIRGGVGQGMCMRVHPSIQLTDRPAPTAQQTNQSSIQPINQLANKITNRPITHPSTHAPTHPTNQTTNKQTNEQIDQPTNLPTDRPHLQPEERLRLLEEHHGFAPEHVAIQVPASH